MSNIQKWSHPQSNHRGRIGYRIFVAALLLISGQGSVTAQQADPDLTTILRNHAQWRKSFATIRVKWHQWTLKDVLESHPELDPNTVMDGKYFTAHEFAWSDRGWFRDEGTTRMAGNVVNRSALGSDGSRPWGTETNYGQQQQDWDSVQFFRPVAGRPCSSNVGLVGIFGLWESRRGEWFADFMPRETAVTLQGFAELDGQRCATLKLTSEAKQGDSNQGNPSAQLEQTIWLDVDHGFVTRKCETRGPVNRKPGIHLYFTWIATEFQRLENSIWFPKRGYFLELDEMPPGTEWVIQEVHLNESLPQTSFAVPNVKPGTKVTDYMTMQGYLSGSSALSPQARSGNTSSTNPTSPNSSTAGNGPRGNAGVPLSATPPQSLWPWIGLCAAVVAIVGIILIWRKRG